MSNKDREITEEDIQKAIRYLKTKDPAKANREDAIKLLQSMQLTAHMIAHDQVEKERKKKQKKRA